MIAEEVLTDVYFIIRNKSGWIRDCVEAGYDQEEIEYLEKLDDGFSDYQPEAEANKWAEDVYKNGGPEMLGLETDDEKMNCITKKIFEFYSEMEKIVSGSWSYLDVFLRRPELKRMERIRNGIRARQVHTTMPNETLADWQIVKAREYPLEKLVMIEGRLPYILCPWHEDKRPSMLVKGGFGYCFSCGAWADSIKWLMEIDKMSFKDAVRRLNS